MTNGLPMIKRWTIITLAAWFAWLASGCQSPEASASKKILTIRLETKTINGSPRLFSTMAFWLCGDALRNRLVGAYRPDGTLDRAKLRQLVPEAEIADTADYVRITVPSGSVRELLLTNQWLASVDPKFDKLIQETADVYQRESGRSPIVIIPPNLTRQSKGGR